MTFTIPTANHLMQTDWDLDGTARGAWSEGQPSTRNTKGQGSLPLTGSAATAFTHNTDAQRRGVFWEISSSGYNVATDTKVLIAVYQYNAPNRLEMDTQANGGIEARLGSGSGSPPTNYHRFYVGGQDTILGKAREFPRMVVLDMNATSEDAEVGTYSNTDVQCFGFGHYGKNMGGSTTMWFFARLFVFDTTKNATNIPRFTGSGSDWDDVITALGTAHNTKISHEWLQREGTIFSVASPIEIGNNSTVTTFNDNGVSVFWPNKEDRIHLTEQAFRVYLNLRNNVADTATFSGYYDAGYSYPPLDFDQDDNAVVTFSGATFNRTGQFDVGSSVTGNANFNDCGVVYCQDNGVDLDGSTFKNPHGNHLLRLAA